MNIAVLTFFQNFRKVYIGEQAMHSSKVYKTLKDTVGIEDHLGALNLMVTKIATNLKSFAGCEEVVEHTLNLFQVFQNITIYISGIVRLVVRISEDLFVYQNKHICTQNFLERVLIISKTINIATVRFLVPFHTF